MPPRIASAIRANRRFWVREIQIVGGLCTAFLALLLLVNASAPTSFDRWVAGSIQSIPWGDFAAIPRAGSDIGGGVYGFYAIPAVAAIVFAALRRWRLLVLLLAVFVLHYVLISPKLFITAYRPSP